MTKMSWKKFPWIICSFLNKYFPFSSCIYLFPPHKNTSFLRQTMIQSNCDCISSNFQQLIRLPNIAAMTQRQNGRDHNQASICSLVRASFITTFFRSQLPDLSIQYCLQDLSGLGGAPIPGMLRTICPSCKINPAILKRKKSLMLPILYAINIVF